MHFARNSLAAIAVAALAGCSAIVDPTARLNGMYDLESVSGKGPTSGTLVLTSKGYVERRVRFKDETGELTREYLTRGTAVFGPDDTIEVEFEDIDPPTGVPWMSTGRPVEGGIELTYEDQMTGEVTVETWRRQ